MASRRGPWVVAVVYVLVMAGGTLPIPLYRIWAPEMHFGAFTTTLVFAVYALGVACSLLVFATASDRLGRRPVMLAALLALAVAAVLFLAASSVAVLLIARLVFGLGVGAAAAAANAWLFELAGPAGERFVAVVSTAANTGGLGLGAVLAGSVVATAPDPVDLLFLAYLGACGMAAIAIARTPETMRERIDRRLELRRPELPPTGGRTAFGSALIAVFAAFAVNGLFSSLIPDALESRFGISNAAAVGGIVSIVFFAALIAQLLPRPRFLLSGPTASLLLAVGVIAVQAGLLLALPAVFLLGEVIAGAGVGLTFRRGIALTQDLAAPRDRAAVTATYLLAAYAGTALPTLLLGAVVSPLGTAAATSLLAAVVLLLIAAAAAVGRHSRPLRTTGKDPR